MLTEDYCNFGIAKLLKEKGFDEVCYVNYSSNGSTQHFNYQAPSDGVPCPTLQMTMKWLREIQGLNIYARGVWKDVEVQYGDWEPAVVGYDWFVESLLDNTYSKMSKEQFLTYEEACEDAIKYCLKNLM